jgi:hypothetical protein
VAPTHAAARVVPKHAETPAFIYIEVIPGLFVRFGRGTLQHVWSMAFSLLTHSSTKHTDTRARPRRVHQGSFAERARASTQPFFFRRPFFSLGTGNTNRFGLRFTVWRGLGGGPAGGLAGAARRLAGWPRRGEAHGRVVAWVVGSWQCCGQLGTRPHATLLAQDRGDLTLSITLHHRGRGILECMYATSDRALDGRATLSPHLRISAWSCAATDQLPAPPPAAAAAAAFSAALATNA